MPTPDKPRSLLDRLMTKQNLSNARLAALVDRSRQDIWKLRDGRTAMSVAWAKLLAPHLNVDWTALIDAAEMPSSAPSEPSEAVSRSIPVPELDVRAMGGGGSVDEALDGNGHHLMLAEWTLPEDYLRSFTPSPGAVKIIRVVGDSMEPAYAAGDRVLIDTAHRIPSPPGVYVIWDGYGLVLKHAQVIPGRSPPVVRFTSTNPVYDAYELPVADVQIQGRVMGKWVWK